MKPPKSKDKVSFGEFKSQAQAARVIDAAFHYYGKHHLLNFPDTPGILSTRPSPAGVLNEKDKLNFVKEQVKWLASVASTLPSPPPLLPPEIPESSSRGCIGDTLGFRQFSEIPSLLSCGVADESNDGISQPLPEISESSSRGCIGGTLGFRTFSEIASFLSCGVADDSNDGISEHLLSLHSDTVAELAGSASMEPPSVGVDAVGSISGTVEEHQGMLECSSEDAFVAPSSSGRWAPASSVQISHGWDGAEVSDTPVLTNLTKSTEPSCESPESWMNYLAMSPPASTLPLPPLSPTSFHGDVTRGLLGSESFGGGEWLRG